MICISWHEQNKPSLNQQNAKEHGVHLTTCHHIPQKKHENKVH